MAERFDPYVEWLGIRESARPLSYYQLLGVPEFEDSLRAIAVAADASLARLKSCNPGERRGRWEQMLDELSLARLCLSDRNRKLQYDTQLRARRGANVDELTPAKGAQIQPSTAWPPTQPKPVEGRATLEPVTVPHSDLFPPGHPSAAAPATETAPLAAVPTQPVPVAVPIAQPAAAYAGIPMARPVGVPVAYPTTIAAPQTPAFVPVAMPVARLVTPSSPVAPLAEVAVEPITETIDDHSPLSGINSPVPLGFGGTNVSPSSMNVRTSWSPDPKSMVIFGVVAVVALLALTLLRRDVTVPLEVAKQGRSNPDAVTIAPQSAIESQTQRDPPKIVEPETNTEPVVPPEPAPSETKPEQVTELANVEKPELAPATQVEPPPQAEQSPEQQAAFARAIKNAHAAMAVRKLDRARQELEAAKANVGPQRQQDQLVRLTALYGYVKGFWNAVADTLQDLQVAETIQIDNTEFAIVEVDGKSITIRAAGRNISYTLDTLPSGLAIALAGRWFDEQVPANKLYLGAFHAVDRKGNINEARRLWQEATQGGASAKTLMPLLDNRPATLVAEQTVGVQSVGIQILDFKGIQKLIESKRGKVVVMDAWSTSCPPCIKECPNLVALHKKYADSRVTCISLSFDYEGIGKPEEVEPKVLDFLKSQGATFDNLLSSEESDVLYRKFKLASVPAVFVYDRQGKLVKRFDNAAAKTEADAFTYQQVETLVKELVGK
jgi:thiol-disulfide isomerase/thioredoxin